ncbi:hypothetical protein KR767_03295 [Luteibacter anthropi]|uniref:hypothetical protein n=1 Tax=Luteibacter anthropi TaxID=564369 RepID=UPI0020330BE1|nr:hypothetical protein [Luteibacter anthropi]URX63109.1 hypothetical protein KR767_03295 [Luteibacter anthropi]
MKPHDILPDDTNSVVLDGVTVRKGTVGAFIVNARVLADEGSDTAARAAALEDALALVPAMERLGVFDVFRISDESLAAAVAAVRDR